MLANARLALGIYPILAWRLVVTFTPELLVAPRTKRYQISSLLGRGATSFVYSALDTEKNLSVALKSLRFRDNDEIFRIKREFRFFRDFYHENLVTLYDLHVDDDACFYTMELIKGLDFVSFVRAHPTFLRPCVGQMVDGLGALHDAGRLHRDLKPSNVLVESGGRTVLLDFGLSMETRSHDSILTETRLYGGTPGYMAPEQFLGEPPSEASDLYAFGVVLYQALTGHRPYPDLPPVALYEAQKAPPRPSENTILPADLAGMALALLSFDPHDRPSLADVRRIAVSGEPRTSTGAGSGLKPRGNIPFVGRDTEMTRLKSLLARTLAGHCVAICVSGQSGIGKTTLIERFLTEAHDEVGALTLRSRCHHQEAVRFNAIDGLIDMLSRYLAAETEQRLADLAPPSLPALITMFPVLGRVPFRVDPAHQESVPKDPQSLVRHALAGLRDLLHRIAAIRPVILWIDDLQWSDAGSLPLLREIVSAGQGEPILSVFSFRTEDMSLDSVAAVLEAEMTLGSEIEIERLPVGPLDEAAVATLIETLNEAGSPSDQRWVKEVAQQSAGLPFFVLEFAAHQPQLSEQGDGFGLNAAAMLQRRIAALPQPQRAVLEIASIAGAPLPEDVLLKIATHASASGREIYMLFHQRLLRKTASTARLAVETYHDHIRTAVLDSLTADRRRHRHREIAEEMERDEDLNHARLVEHWLGADEPGLATDHAILAGRGARERLNFQQAAQFFRLASRLRDPFANNAGLAIDLAHALADAGHSAESGDLFLRIAHEVTEDRYTTTACVARAAQQFLYSGHLSTSQAVYRRLFDEVGLPFPGSVRSARRMSLRNRLSLVAGLGRIRLRPVRDRSIDPTRRVDLLWAASKGFMMLDFMIGDALFTCYMREAARLGERARIMRGMALESLVLTNVGQRWSIRRAEALTRKAQPLGHSSDPYDRVVLSSCQAGMAWFRGRWSDAAALAREAIELHRRECVRYDFDVAIMQAYRLSALVMQGALVRAKGEAVEAVSDAERRGDAYVSRLFKSGYLVYVTLGEDDAPSAIAHAATLLNDLPPNRFTSMHWAHFIATVNALVYADRAWDAWDAVQRYWPAIEETGFLKLACLGAHLREIRTRAALKAAAAGVPSSSSETWTRERLLRLADADAAKIAQTSALSHAQATAAAIRSAIAALRGNPERRRVLLAAACQGFGETGMALHHAAAELQYATLIADHADVGIDAEHKLEREGVAQPQRFSAFLMFA